MLKCLSYICIGLTSLCLKDLDHDGLGLVSIHCEELFKRLKSLEFGMGARPCHPVINYFFLRLIVIPKKLEEFGLYYVGHCSAHFCREVFSAIINRNCSITAFDLPLDKLEDSQHSVDVDFLTKLFQRETGWRVGEATQHQHQTLRNIIDLSPTPPSWGDTCSDKESAEGLLYD